MRKSYHRTLTDKIRELMLVLDNHYAKLSDQLKVIQLLFIETQYVEGRPLLSNATLKIMALTYSIGAKYLAPSQETREAFRSLPLANPAFKSCFLSPPAPPMKVGWFTPWSVKVILPKQLIAKVELEKLQAFLYCPSQKEVGHHKYWFEKEQAADSFTHQLNSVLAICHEEDQINLNAAQYAMPIFEQAIGAWRSSVNHSDKITQNNDSLYALPFVPHDEQSCWQAWQEVVKTIHQKQCRHRRGLLAIYREKLEQAFFQGLNIEENVRSDYLSNFRAQVLDKFPQPKNQKGGRWEQAEIPDCYTASRIIRYIAQHFVDDPEDKAWGEAVIALWVMVWAAQSIQRYFGSFETYSELLKKINQGSGVFVAINQTDGNGRKRENVTKVRAFFVDLDGSPLESIRQVPLDPHMIIESSPGRYHAYWLVEDAPLDSFESMQKQLAERFGGDPSVCDLPRLMRLPGFLHRKQKPYQSRILETSATLPYSFQKFQEAFDTSSAAPQEQIPLNPLDSPALTKLREQGLVKRLENEEEGRWLICCPWAHEHTTAGEEAYYFSKPNPGYKGAEGFQCFHAHCRDRNISTLRFFLGLSPIAGLDPLPLFREIGAPPTFPIEALGAIMGKAAIEIHKTIQAPLAVIGQSLLGVASLVTQGHANIQIDGREVALSLFLITVAESGERKSAVDDVVLSAVLDWQQCLWRTYKQERAAYEAALERWQEEKKNGSSAQSPEPPLMPIMVVEEPTYEGLVKYLEHGQPSIGLFSDEGGRFLGGNAMNRDNLLKTLAGFSSLWDAKSNKPITRMRSSDQSLALYGRRVALHLLIQESVYSKLNQQSMCESQGFLPRCLISFPESMAGTRTYVTENPRELPSVKIFRDQCNTLLDRRFPIAEPPAPKNQLTPPTISLTRDAYAKWIEFHNKLETQLGKQGAYYQIRRFGSKAAEHVLRIAGVFAVFEHPSTSKVEIGHIGRAIEIIEYYLLERLRLDSYACIDPALLTAQKVLDWAEVKGKQGVLLRDLYQYGPSEVRSKETASAILKVLEEHGRAFPVPAHEITPGGKGKAWRFT